MGLLESLPHAWLAALFSQVHRRVTSNHTSLEQGEASEPGVPREGGREWARAVTIVPRDNDPDTSAARNRDGRLTSLRAAPQSAGPGEKKNKHRSPAFPAKDATDVVDKRAGTGVSGGHIENESKVTDKPRQNNINLMRTLSGTAAGVDNSPE